MLAFYKEPRGANISRTPESDSEGRDLHPYSQL